jgi:ABC-type lipoprotein release transport system permease subunit
VAAEFVVRGILSFPNPELNKQFSYLDLGRAQEFYSSMGKLTSLALMLNDYSDLNSTMKQLEAKIDSPYTALSWKEMQPEMVQMIESDRAGGDVMKAILYIVIGFGILGTIMMMMAERRKELGLMVAVGMQKHKLAEILFYETLYMGIIGVFSGIIISIPIIMYFIQNPIPITGDAAEAMIDMGIAPELLFTTQPKIFISQLITVFAITLAVSFYPLLNALRLKEIKYLRD